MTEQSPIERGKTLASELAEICRDLKDDQISELFANGTIDELLNAILDPTTVGDYPTIADFFLANKQRSSLVAAIRAAITKHYSFEGKSKAGETGYASPNDIQWFEDGVMLLEGPKPFEGLIGLYRDGHMSYAVAARDAQPGDKLGPDAFHFVDIEDTEKRFNDAKLPEEHELDTPARTLVTC